MNLQAFLLAVRESVLPEVASYGYFLTEIAHRPHSESGHTVLVGCGAWDHPQVRASRALVLQNKDVGRWAGVPYSSVTRLIAGPAGAYIEAWAGWPPETTQLQPFVDRLQLVAEDGSPDSIFGYLLFLARAMRVPLNSFPQDWIHAVDDWERTGTAEQPFRSWCSLESALAHSSLPGGVLDGPSTYTEAWRSGLLFAVSCLERHENPLQLPLEPVSTLHARAKTALKQDERTYHDWLQYAPTLQLSLPVRDLPGRYQLVDALVIEEDQFTGAAKNFYRNDLQHSPLKEGFTLSLVYRPHSTESAYDITISVDPRQGVWLYDLWEALEEAETKAWSAEQRPSDNPRRLHGATTDFNEPWFINSEGTLIGSPRKVNGIFAGKLSWTEVQNLVLRECNPLRPVKVLAPGMQHPVSLLEVVPEYRSGADRAAVASRKEKTLLLASWPSEAARREMFLPLHLPESPTVRCLLAALLNPEKGADTVALVDVAADSSFEYLPLTGGFAIVSDRGLFVLDDWTKERLQQDEIRSSFRDAAQLHVSLNQSFAHELPEIYRRLKSMLSQSYNPSDRSWIANQLVVLGLQTAHLRGETAAPSANSNVRLVREAMDRRWSLERRLAALENAIGAVQAALRSFHEAHNASVTHFVAVYGFALFLASALAAPIAKTAFHYWTRDHSASDAPGLWVLLTFVALTASLWCILWIRDRSANPLK